MLYLSTAVYSAGLLLAGIVKSPVLFTIIGSVIMGGFVMISIILMSTIRDHTPLEHVGMFQGIRLLAYVLIPMIIGPNIGDLIIHMSDAGTYINEYGETVSLPVAGVFFAAAAACLLIMIPGRKLFSEDPSANH
jgi:MFS family permease